MAITEAQAQPHLTSISGNNPPEPSPAKNPPPLVPEDDCSDHDTNTNTSDGDDSFSSSSSSSPSTPQKFDRYVLRVGLPTPQPPPGAVASPKSSRSVVVDSNSDSFQDHNRFDRFLAAIAGRLSRREREREFSGANRENLESVSMRGRIAFFSRSNCRDSTAVRSFLREKGLRFDEINIDVYPERTEELVRRTESSQVPQIFFNESLFGGIVALNSLRNSGGFDRRVEELLGVECPSSAPAPPVYGYNEAEETEEEDELVEAVRELRRSVPVRDRLVRMRLVRNCFSGAEAVDVLTRHLHSGRNKATEIGKQLARKHFIHHVFGKNDFEDGNQFYCFLEHGPSIPKCYNFKVSTNDREPKPAAEVGIKLTKLMSAILESYASDDRSHIDYAAISKSEEFRRYLNLVQELHRVNLMELSSDEKLTFFLNLYNAMVIHAVIRLGRPEGIFDRTAFSSDFQYMVGGHPYSLDAIKNGILRSNRRPPYSFVKPFGSGDKRAELCLPKVNPLIHFGLCNGAKSSPKVRFFPPQVVEAQLRGAARDFFRNGNLEVDLTSRTVYLTRIMKWSSVDFGQEKDMLKWTVNYLDPSRAGLLMHLLGDGGSIRIVYQNYDWSVNS